MLGREKQKLLGWLKIHQEWTIYIEILSGANEQVSSVVYGTICPLGEFKY